MEPNGADDSRYRANQHNQQWQSMATDMKTMFDRLSTEDEPSSIMLRMVNVTNKHDELIRLNSEEVNGKDMINLESKNQKKIKKKPYVMDSDHRLLIKNSRPLLQSRNAAVSVCDV